MAFRCLGDCKATKRNELNQKRHDETGDAKLGCFDRRKFCPSTVAVGALPLLMNVSEARAVALDVVALNNCTKRIVGDYGSWAAGLSNELGFISLRNGGRKDLNFINLMINLRRQDGKRMLQPQAWRFCCTRSPWTLSADLEMDAVPMVKTPWQSIVEQCTHTVLNVLVIEAWLLGGIDTSLRC